MAEHIAILKAIEARDADTAAALVDEHLMTVEHQLTERPRAPHIPALVARRQAFGVSLDGPATGYMAVYGLEMLLLVATLFAMGRLVADGARPAQSPNPAYRSAP